jgi:hypothetical protein
MADYESELTKAASRHSEETPLTDYSNPLDWPASPHPTPNHIGLSPRDLATDIQSTSYSAFSHLSSVS